MTQEVHMRVVAISRVKNEEDIVEPFVRHHCRLFDELFVLDDWSTDRTPEILASLGAEGLRVRLLREDCVGVVQGVSMTRLMHEAFADGADWVVPLDADEFFEVVDRDAYERILSAKGTGVVELPWDSFVYGGPDESDVNPVVRLKEHTPTRRWNYKVMVPRRLGSRKGTWLFEGSHFLYDGKTRVDSERHACVRLCHYPIRSVSQYASKVAVGMARYAMLHDKDPEWAYHYEEPFRTLLADMDAFAERARADSLNYSLAPSEPRDEVPVVGPLRYLGGDLRYTTPKERLVQNLANYLEQLARAMAKVSKRLHDAENESRREPFKAGLFAFLGRVTGAVSRVQAGETGRTR